MNTTTLHLAKQNFKFSAAHFLIFDEKSAEKLHGHNYQVQVDIKVSDDLNFSQQGYFVDFNVFKKAIKSKLDHWDEHVLLPANHHEMLFKQEGSQLHVDFRDRKYSFPSSEVHLLPVTNTSTEQLADILAQELFQEFKKFGVKALTVRVEETPGQGASVEITGES